MNFASRGKANNGYLGIRNEKRNGKDNEKDAKVKKIPYGLKR